MRCADRCRRTDGAENSSNRIKITMKRFLCGLVLFSLIFPSLRAARLLVEAEAFDRKGGWVVDQQFSDQMGSSYLMAHGLGVPVTDAETTVVFPKRGLYTVYVRTYNWTSPWFSGRGPGRFCVRVNEVVLPAVGDSGSQWEWQRAGEVRIDDRRAVVALHDLTGFNGRCDAVYFTDTPGDVPPADLSGLAKFRKRLLPETSRIKKGGRYDLVVSGGGIAGMCAAVSAARLGLKVALINDRPVLGGNNSSEVRVHLGGRIALPPYPELGNLIKEVGPLRGGNAQPADYYEDRKKADWIAAEKNIALFSNFRVFEAVMSGSTIEALLARHIETGEVLRFEAPLFSDCTGDGTIGYLAGADYAVGREAFAEYHEARAPAEADRMTMGASVQWYSSDVGISTDFPLFDYGLPFHEQSAERVTMGEWTWETGMDRDQIEEFESIRDYGLMVVFSNWSFLKNVASDREKYRTRKLDWVAYVAGKRESRRLLGDVVLTGNDIRNGVFYPDATASVSWSIDLHYPDPDHAVRFPSGAFKSIAEHEVVHFYPVPYRCLYSRNISNLFMAGRNVSVTHVALGTVRVMRTTGMLGEVVGMAAFVCRKRGVEPRTVYTDYWDDLKALMREGTGKKGLPNNQIYNQGATLGPR